MFNFSINIWEVIIGTVVSIIVGMLWYGPICGKAFRKAMGMEKWSKAEQEAMKKKMGGMYALQIVASIIMFAVLSALLRAWNVTTWLAGLHYALVLWLGFVVPVTLGREIWGGKMQLFYISAGNFLITLAIVGSIMGAWF